MKESLFNPFALMATPETKKKHRHQITIGRGDIGAVVSLGGSLAVAGLIAVFAMRTRFGRFSWRRDGVRKKQENVEELNVRDQYLAELDSLDPLHKLKPQYLAAIAEEPKSPAVDGSDLPLNLPNPALMEPPSSVEKLIIWKPLFREAIPEAELSTIKEGEKEKDDDEYGGEEDESVSEGKAAEEEIAVLPRQVKE